jgi:hypothetical protein
VLVSLSGGLSTVVMQVGQLSAVATHGNGAHEVRPFRRRISLQHAHAPIHPSVVISTTLFICNGVQACLTRFSLFFSGSHNMFG